MIITNEGDGRMNDEAAEREFAQKQTERVEIENSKTIKIVVNLGKDAATKILEMYQNAKEEGVPFEIGGFLITSVTSLEENSESKKEDLL